MYHSAHRVSIKTFINAFAVICKEKLSYWRLFCCLKSDIPYCWKPDFVGFLGGWELRAVPVRALRICIFCAVFQQSERICRGSDFISPAYNLCPPRGVPLVFEVWNSTFPYFSLKEILGFWALSQWWEIQIMIPSSSCGLFWDNVLLWGLSEKVMLNFPGFCWIQCFLF